MQKSTLIQIILGLTLSLVAGVLVFNWLGTNGSQQAAAPAPRQVMLLVAAQDIPKGTRLTEELLKEASFLETSAPSGGFTAPEELTGRVVATAVAAGEPITALRLVDPKTQFGKVSALITPGKRAIAVKGNKILGIAGFIHPGNRVDVLVTIDDERRSKNLSVTKTVLENILVLATGTELEVEGENETSSIDIYTLELSPKEAEVLSLSATRGELHFALRNPADKDKVKTTGANVPSALQSLALAKPTPKKQTRRRPRGPVVEVIVGNERGLMRF